MIPNHTLIRALCHYFIKLCKIPAGFIEENIICYFQFAFIVSLATFMKIYVLVVTIMRCLVEMPREVILDKTRVGRYYRTTIPESVRKFLEVKEGDEVEWVFNDDKIYIRKATSG